MVYLFNINKQNINEFDTIELAVEFLRHFGKIDRKGAYDRMKSSSKVLNRFYLGEKKVFQERKIREIDFFGSDKVVYW